MKNGRQSICPFCSMGCVLELRPASAAPYVGQGELAALDYVPEGGVNRGSLCAKGNMSLELLSHPARLDAPQIRTGDVLATVRWSDALERIVTDLGRVRREDGPQAVGILVGPYLTNEEAKLAARLARVIGTPHLDLSQPEDRVVMAGLRRSGAAPEPVTSIEEIDQMRAVLVVGDLFTQAPCVAKSVLNARYDRRDNLLATLGFWRSRTAIFGKPALHCGPGREAAALMLILKLVLAKWTDVAPGWAPAVRAALDGFDLPVLEELSGLRTGDLEWPLGKLAHEERSGVLLGVGFAETERPDLVAGLSALVAEATGSRFLPMYCGPNTAGVSAMLRDEGFPGTHGLTAPEMAEAAAKGDLKALLVFSADPVGTSPGRVADSATRKPTLVATTAPFAGETTALAHVVLPAATWGEKRGFVENAFRQRQELEAAIPPPGAARTDGHVLSVLCEQVEALAAPQRETAAAPVRGEREEPFFDELALHLRLERREDAGHEVGSHTLFPEFAASHAGDGWLTRPLSWPQHEMPHPQVAVSPAHAARLGVVAGDTVRVRSRDAEAYLHVRIERRLDEGVVLAPPHFPEVRRLAEWRLDPVLRDLDPRPCRVSIEALAPVGGGATHGEESGR